MYSSRCNCNHDSSNSCGRNGERILVNQGCGCRQNRRRCACQNTFRPGCGCGGRQDRDDRRCDRDNCRCDREERCDCDDRRGDWENQRCDRDDRGNRCGCRPCPPKPCPRPTCEDRCRAQYRQCLRNCRCREDDDNRESSYDFDEEDYGRNE